MRDTQALQHAISELRVLSVGHVTHDRYGAELVAGGCAYYGAVTAARLGAYSALLGAVGDDFVLDDALAPLGDRSLTRRGQTTVFTNIYPEGAPRVQQVEARAPELRPAMIPGGWRGTFDLLLLAPVLGELSPVDPWSAHVAAPCVTMILQGYMKRAAPAEREGVREVIPLGKPLPNRLFLGVDAVFVSSEDIALFGDDRTTSLLRAAVPLLYVTQGESGCLIFQGEQPVQRVGVFPTGATDPTGAGDSFAMGTSLGLAAGCSPCDAARLGAAVASIMVEGVGSRPASRLAEAFERVARVQVSPL